MGHLHELIEATLAMAIGNDRERFDRLTSLPRPKQI